jgi:hypothetical protein
LFDPRDPRDVFTRELNLPRGLEREIVRHRDREYTLRGSEVRTLATVGAFRVVSSRDIAAFAPTSTRRIRPERLVQAQPYRGPRACLQGDPLRTSNGYEGGSARADCESRHGVSTYEFACTFCRADGCPHDQNRGPP